MKKLNKPNLLSVVSENMAPADGVRNTISWLKELLRRGQAQLPTCVVERRRKIPEGRNM